MEKKWRTSTVKKTGFEWILIWTMDIWNIGSLLTAHVTFCDVQSWSNIILRER